MDNKNRESRENDWDFELRDIQISMQESKIDAELEEDLNDRPYVREVATIYYDKETGEMDRISFDPYFIAEDELMKADVLQDVWGNFKEIYLNNVKYFQEELEENIKKYGSKQVKRWFKKEQKKIMAERTRKKVFESEVTISFIGNRTYADDIESDSRYDMYYDWHFLNMELDDEYEDITPSERGDVFIAINK